MLKHLIKSSLACDLRRPFHSTSASRAHGLVQLNQPPGSSFAFTIVNCTYNPSSRLCQGKHHFHSSQSVQQKTSTEHGFPELEISGPVPYIERTTALLTKLEAERYLYPLYCRGWEIKSMSPNDGFNYQDQKSPFLVGNFTFKGPKSARKFLHELISIEEEEKHHVSFDLWSGKRPVLTVVTQTHSARKYLLSESASDNSTEPGITLRDIRLAVLLENFAEHSKLIFSPESTEEHNEVAQNRSLSQKPAWEELLSQYPWKLTEK